MQKIKKILLATDFSQASRDAAKSAALLAAKTEAKVYVLHVVPRLHGWSVDESVLMQKVNNILRDDAEAIRGVGVPDVETAILIGNPPEEIVGHANLLEVNVIMIGSGEKNKGDRFPLGVTAENIIRSAFRPVWVVKRGSPETIGKILCPIDFSGHSRLAFANALALSEVFAAKLEVLNVTEKYAGAYYGMSFHASEIQAGERKYARKEIDQFLREFDLKDVNCERTVRSGKPHEEVLKAVTESGAELLVMGSLGRTGVTRILLGSVALKIARELPCSFVMTKSQDLIEQSRPINVRKPRKKFVPLEEFS